MCKLLRTKFLKILQNYSATRAGVWNARFSIRTIYARCANCANCANDSGGTIPHKRVFSFKQFIRHYPALSVTIRHYPALSGNRYSKKQYLCTRNRARTLGDKQNWTSCSSRAQTQFLRSTSVHSPFDLRSTLALHSFFLRSTTENKRKKTEKNGEQTNPKRRRSEEAANLRRIYSEFTAN